MKNTEYLYDDVTEAKLELIILEMARKANQILDEVQRRAGEKILIPVREQIINEMINENETHNTRNK